MTDVPQTAVRQRSLFYLSGFDPKGAGHYHALYRSEAAKQARISGISVRVGKRGRTPEGNATWALRSESDGVDTHCEFLRWDDIVRQHWTQGTPRLWRDVLRTSLFNLRHGALWRICLCSWPAGLALFLPFVLVLAQMLGAPLLGGLTALALWEMGLTAWLAAAAGVFLGAAAWWLTHRLEARYAMYWMMRSYAFTRLQALDQLPALEKRLDEHAARLVARWRETQDDELLLVGHSTGAVMAVSVLARACALEPRLGVAGVGPRVALLTLGQCIVLLGVLPQAQRFRDELAALAASNVDWIDFSAPPDGCCFALTDPYAVCGVANPRDHFPKLLNPRFAEMFDAQRYRALKSDKFQMHFQYLLAGERATDYDYFAITAGGRCLAERFAQTASVSNYRDLQPFRRWR